MAILKTLVGVIIVFGVLFVIWRYYWPRENVKDGVLLPPRDVKISEYSLNGRVAKVEAGRLTITAGIVTKTSEGNVVVFRDKTVLVSDKTQLVNFSKLSDLKYNDSVVVYTVTEPYTAFELSAIKIELEK